MMNRIKAWVIRVFSFYAETSIQLTPGEVAPLLENNYDIHTLSRAMDSSENYELKELYRAQLKDAWVRNHALIDKLYIEYGGPDITKHLNRPRPPQVTFYNDRLLIPLVEDTVHGLRTKKGKK
tara:strand:+ start:350 stop:718 length:369 start_codon:yes stop_codon:yes gene_type:complete